MNKDTKTLNAYHTHFVLIDDDKIYSDDENFDFEIKLRTKLELSIEHLFFTRMIYFIIGGEMRVVKFIYDYVKNERPCIFVAVYESI
jgi:hypothetical protein